MRKSLSWKSLLLTGALVVSCAFLTSAQALAQHVNEPASYWRAEGRKAVQKSLNMNKNSRIAKNVIIMIGDGMNIPTVTAARIYEWQKANPGVAGGEQHQLCWDKFPYVALSKTYCANAQVTDSAAAMSAIMTGVKTKDGLLGCSAAVTPHMASTVPGNKTATLMEKAKRCGLATGVVTTTTITHATPAGCYAHSPDRDWECDAYKSADDPANADFPDIARQLVEWSCGNGMDVALGGGRQFFMTNTTADPEYTTKYGKRLDGRDLTAEWAAQEGAAYVWNKTQFDAIDPATTNKLLGLFEQSHMRFEADRVNDTAGEPSLAEMTGKAIDILSKNKKGFVLMVEGGKIDHAHHANSAFNVLEDTLAFSQAVQTAIDKTNARDTLIIVTADHGHVMTFAGYATRGNPILGKVTQNDKWGEATTDLTLAADGKPYTTLLYGNGPGCIWDASTGRPDLTSVDTAAPTYIQQAAAPTGSDTHSGEDVAIYANGPGAYLFHGVQEESYIFHACNEAMKLNYR